MPRPPNGQRNPRFPPGALLPKGLKAVFVEWVDSATLKGWEPSDHDKATTIFSVAIEVARTDETIVLSTSFNGGSLFSDQLTIPLKAVKRITRLL